MSTHRIEIGIVSCDLCNIRAFSSMLLAPSVIGAEPARRRIVTPGPEEAPTDQEKITFLRKNKHPGYYFGTHEEALLLGWQEREYGLICPPCIEKEAAQAALDAEQKAESFVHNAFSKGFALEEVVVKAMEAD